MSPLAVEVKNLTKSFLDSQALRGVSLEIKDGEFFSLLGPSGCGKTTLLRTIAGFETPTSGSVFIYGQNMEGIPPHKRPGNMVFQSYALFPHLNVFENIAFGLKLSKKFRPDEIEQRVNWALDLVRLPNLKNRFPRELSGGQQQRVAFARAIVNRPSVLLLDEPLSALDPKIRQEMQSELARFKKELNITFIMVTHDQAEAFGLSDRIAVLSSGLIEQVGSPQEIFSQPATPFVADFIGQSNLLAAEVLECRGRFCRVIAASSLELWAATPEAPLEFMPGHKVTVWIRSSALGLLSDNDTVSGADPVNDFPVEIIHRSFQGATYDFCLKAGNNIDLVASLSAENSQGWDAGQSCRVVIPASQVQVMV